MKKTYFCGIFLVFFAAAASGASLTVLQPNGGESLRLGQPYPIRWTAIGIRQKVKLVLLKQGVKIGIIASDIAADSSPFDWTVGRLDAGAAATGDGYQIRVRTMDNEVQDLSDGFFSLVQGGTATLRISSPNGGEDWLLGETRKITWINDLGSGSADISLERNGAALGLIAGGYPLTAGTLSWKAGEVAGGMAPAGGGYRIRIKAVGSQFADASDNEFTLSARPGVTLPDLAVTGARYENGAVKATVRNLGEKYIGPLCLRPSIPAFGQMKDAIYPVRTIEKNGEETFSIPVPAWPEGTGCLPGTVEVDPNRGIVESNEDNNRFNGPVCDPNFQAGLPDFRVKGFSFVSHPPSRYLIELANDGVEFRGQVQVRVIAMDKLQGGELAYEKTVTTCLATFPAHGTYGFVSELVDLGDHPGVCSGAFGLVVDPGNEIREADEKNNFLEQPFFSKEWGGNWRSIHPAEVRIGKTNLLLLKEGQQRVLPAEDARVSISVRNCRPWKQDMKVVFLFDGVEIARASFGTVPAGGSHSALTAIRVPRTPDFKILAIHVLDEIHGHVNPAFPDFQARVRVD